MYESEIIDDSLARLIEWHTPTFEALQTVFGARQSGEGTPGPLPQAATVALSPAG